MEHSSLKTVEMPSRLNKHLDLVIDRRRNGLTWAQIAQSLKDEHQVTTTPQNLWKWFRRRQEQAKKVAEELRPFAELDFGSGARISDRDDASCANVSKPPNNYPKTSASPTNDHRPEPADDFQVGDDILK